MTNKHRLQLYIHLPPLPCKISIHFSPFKRTIPIHSRHNIRLLKSYGHNLMLVEFSGHNLRVLEASGYNLRLVKSIGHNL